MRKIILAIFACGYVAFPSLGNTQLSEPSKPPIPSKELERDVTALYNRLQACWNPASGSDPAVTVILKLKQNGTLDGEPRVVPGSGAAPQDAAIKRALEAVKRCQPFRLSPGTYEGWKEIQVTFQPVPDPPSQKEQ
jgi:TonB C terminal